MKLMFKFCVLIMFISVSSAISKESHSKIDSMFIKIQQPKNQDDRIRAYTNVLLYYSTRDFDSSIYFSKQAVNLFQKDKDKVAEGRIYHTMANIYKDRLSFDTSKFYINKAFVLFNSFNYEKGIAKCYQTNGIIATQLADYKLAANYFMRGLKIAEKLNDVNGIIQGYTNMGGVYGYLENPKKAIYYFQKAQDLNQLEYGEPNYKIFGNMASSYYEMGNFQSALTYYKICIEKYLEFGVEQDDYISFLTEAGDCEFALNNISNAVQYYNEAYPMSVEAGLPKQQCIILFQLALIYKKDRKLDLALDYVKKSANLAKQHHQLELLVPALELQSQLYSDLNQFSLAYLTYKEHNSIKDSLQSFEQKKDVELLEADYKVEKSNAEIEKLALLNQKNTLLKSIYLIFFISFLIIALILYTSLSKRNLLNRMLEKSNKVKDRLLSIIAHDLKSPLSNIVSVLDAIDQGAFSKEEQREIVDALKNQTNVTLETLENLLKWGQAQISGITVNPEKFKITDQLSKTILFVSAQANSKNIKIDLIAEHDWDGHFDQEHFNFIVRNYLANAIKFSPANSTIIVHTDLDSQKNTLKISIIDKGVGIKSEDVPTIFQEAPKVNYGTNNERGSGLGLRLCKEFAEANKGDVGFKTKVGEGSEFYFTCKAA